MRSRRLRAAGALALAVGLAGCMTTAVLVGPEKTDLGLIGVGKSRPEVERVLGEPERRAGNVASYRIYTDTSSLAKGADSALEEAQATMWAAIGDAVMTMILVGQPVMIYDYLQRREDAQAMINVVYTPDDRVMGLSLESAVVSSRRTQSLSFWNRRMLAGFNQSGPTIAKTMEQALSSTAILFSKSSPRSRASRFASKNTAKPA